MDQGRGTKRYASQHELRVRCETWGEFVSLYAADVSQGGMFILTANPPPPLSDIEVTLRLPEGHEVRLQARVVHILDEAQATEAGRAPGVGVEFMSLDEVQKAQIHQLVEFARWQGTSHRPTATLASHMFELNAPAPPAQLLADEPAPRSRMSSGPPAPRITTVPSVDPGSEGEAEGPAPRKRKRRRASNGSMRTVSVGEGESKKENPSESQSESQSEAAPKPPPPKPTNLEQLKVGMTHLARKRFDEATRTFRKMLEDNPGDPEAGKWLHVTEARLAISRSDEAAAEASYQRAIAIDEQNAEARKFLRDVANARRLNSIPFGRYFVKKRPTDH